MSERYPVIVADVLPATEELTELVLDVRGTPLEGTHQAPGQYVHLELPGVGEAPFAIASAPERSRWEFLLKVGRTLPDALARLKPGTVVHSSKPRGRGFPLEASRGRDLLLFATGSAISPIRSVIERLRQERSAWGQVTLYFGARKPAAFAYKGELEHWEAAGIRVIRTVSQPGESGWEGLTGYVQAHLGEEPLDGVVAFVCGQSKMVQGVMEALEARGVPRSAVHLNY